MEKLVNEIVALLNPNGKIDKILYRGAVGFIASTILFLVFVKGIYVILNVTKAASSESQEGVAIACTVMFVVVLLFFCYYVILYTAMLVITLLKYGFRPSYKNVEQSVESIMTSEVEDTRRLHKAIIKYLKEYSDPIYFAALYIWLDENHLLRTIDQKRFLDVLKTDFPDSDTSDTENSSIRVPSQSSLSEQKTKLEADSKKLYKEHGFDVRLQRLFHDFIKD